MDLTSYKRAAQMRRNTPSTLKISGRVKAPASFAQQRIWLHEKLYFNRQSSSLAIYNILLPMKIKCGSLSIDQLRLATLSVLEKHLILRTAVRFNGETNQLEQEVQPLSHDLYSFEHTRNICSSELLDALLTAETLTNYFDVENGKVVRCHLVQNSNNADTDNLHSGDLVIFVIHHIAFDNTSLQLFAMALVEAYRQSKVVQTISKAPQYIDFTLYEQTLVHSPSAEQARQFWRTLLQGYDWTKTFLQFTNHSQTQIKSRSGRGYSIAFNLDPSLVQAQMDFAASRNVSMFQLCLACYYVFLFKMSAEQDLCVASTTQNRPLPEMKSMIGMFANTVPYRIKVDPHQSFHEFLVHVQKLCFAVFEHEQLPYQHILGVQSNEKHPMPQTFFHYESLVSSVTHNTTVEIPIGDKNSTVFEVYHDRDRAHGNGLALFDITLAMAHNHHTRTTECVIECSADLFDQARVDELADRFSHLLHQLCHSSDCSINCQRPLHQLPAVLPQEQLLIDALKTHDINRPFLTNNTIHRLFTEQTLIHPQKIAVELDEQMISYNELFLSAQKLALNLIDEHSVKEGDIICQCVERSITMIIGMMAIELCGGVYCPLSPRDPLLRLQTLVKQTQCQVVLVHGLTENKFDLHSTTVNIDALMSINNSVISEMNVDGLSNVMISGESIAYIIFTSGSTGTPKAVSTFQ